MQLAQNGSFLKCSEGGVDSWSYFYRIQAILVLLHMLFALIKR